MIYNEIKAAYDYALQHPDEDLVKKAKDSGELMTIEEKPVENPVGFTIFVIIFFVVVLLLLIYIFI